MHQRKYTGARFLIHKIMRKHHFAPVWYVSKDHKTYEQPKNSSLTVANEKVDIMWIVSRHHCSLQYIDDAENSVAFSYRRTTVTNAEEMKVTRKVQALKSLAKKNVRAGVKYDEFHWVLEFIHDVVNYYERVTLQVFPLLHAFYLGLESRSGQG